MTVDGVQVEVEYKFVRDGFFGKKVYNIIVRNFTTPSFFGMVHGVRAKGTDDPRLEKRARQEAAWAIRKARESSKKVIKV